ncbi:3-keto-5-aminohexanoate cleavage protein [Arthrobacter sp. MMS18-M83]|uniref:3-keto-5-aminohexanoate cleavage protein n=1 Tax=Arthrobacter sp. MMS18-M83 TaxID=2996261 RepID=UPI00227AAE67|nr:3-keto-5-aminohexanoate cleavage protein [Arthrobacter sp. MMS18-M83]WAH97767.1 3-keto-5-aminohexanoate cleavage protein [Arthrobacter sp. MMS18-M83]
MSKNVQLERPLVIETAMSGVVANTGGEEQTTAGIVTEAKNCLAAGAGIVHIHHDFSLGLDDAIAQVIDINRRVLSEHPGALLYPAYMPGHKVEEQMRHLRPLHESGQMTMFAFDPGTTEHGRADKEGLMTGSIVSGTTFSQATKMVELSHKFGVPVSLGIFNPGFLTWVRSLGAAGKFTPGTVAKFYFAGGPAWGAKGSGSTFGLPPTKEALDLYLDLIDGANIPWFVSLMGGEILKSDLLKYAIEKGGNIRTGQEDPLRVVGTTNAEMVQQVIDVANEVGRPVAKWHEAFTALSSELSPVS